jgi:hypothetical protein
MRVAPHSARTRVLRLLACVAAVSAVTSCAAKADEEGMVVVSPSRVRSASLSMEWRGDALLVITGVHGSTIDVAFDGDELRGRVGGAAVNLSVQRETITGLIGDQPVNLRVRTDDGAVHASGTFRGAIARLDVEAGGLSGTLGTCSYEIKRLSRQGTYAGAQHCEGGTVEPVSVRTGDLSLGSTRTIALFSLVLAS